jgi:hypothetical protein
MNESFYVYLPSNSKGTNNNNKTSSFTIQLSKRLNFSDASWSVALTNIIYPISWPNLGTYRNEFIDINWKGKGNTRLYLPSITFKNSPEELLSSLFSVLNNASQKLCKRTRRSVVYDDLWKLELELFNAEDIISLCKMNIQIAGERMPSVIGKKVYFETLKKLSEDLIKEYEIRIATFKGYVQAKEQEMLFWDIEKFYSEIQKSNKILAEKRQELSILAYQLTLTNDEVELVHYTDIEWYKNTKELDNIDSSPLWDMEKLKQHVNKFVSLDGRTNYSGIDRRYLLDSDGIELRNKLSAYPRERPDGKSGIEWVTLMESYGRIQSEIMEEKLKLGGLERIKQMRKIIDSEKENEYNTMIIKLKNLENDNEKYKKEIKNLKEINEKLEIAKKKMRENEINYVRELEILNENITKEKEKLSKIESEQKSTEEDRRKLEKEIENFKENIFKKDEIIKALEKRIVDMRVDENLGDDERVKISSELENLKIEKKRIEDERNKLLQELGNKENDETKKFMKKIEEIEKDRADVIIERDRHEKEKIRFEKMIIDLKREITKKEEEKLKSKMDIENIENENSKVKAEGDRLRQQLESYKREIIPDGDENKISMECDIVNWDLGAIYNYLKFTYDSDRERYALNLNREYIERVELSEQLKYIMGFDNKYFGEEISIARYLPDLSGGIHTLYIYAPSLIEHTIIGDISAPLLRIAKVKGKTGDIVEDTFLNPQYYRVIEKTVSQIKIDINTNTGRPVPFNYGDCILTLHFRKNLII